MDAPGLSRISNTDDADEPVSSKTSDGKDSECVRGIKRKVLQTLPQKAKAKGKSRSQTKKMTKKGEGE